MSKKEIYRCVRINFLNLSVIQKIHYGSIDNF